MQHTTQHIQDSLKTLYPPEEIRWFIRLIFSHVCGWSYNQQLLCKDKQISENEKEEVEAIINRLKEMEPLQYIFGETEFYSLPLQVNPHVLIPRPETEELVDRIINRFNAEKTNIDKTFVTHHQPPTPGTSPAFRLLDIGTGSGCIAIALAKHIPGATVSAIDISQAALQTAKENANINQTEINFIQADILQTENVSKLVPCLFDLIVSNPPYIRENERKSMSANVLNYEPHSALFVPDKEPLLFYEAIADFALRKLTPNGLLYFEINPLCDTMMIDMLQAKGFEQPKLFRDLSGKNRFCVTRNRTH